MKTRKDGAIGDGATDDTTAFNEAASMKTRKEFPEPQPMSAAAKLQ